MALSGQNNNRYAGPQSGSTPCGAADLHQNGDNPFSGGAPGMEARGGTGIPFNVGSLPGYYQNPATDPNNQFSGGAGDYDSAEQSLSAAYAQGLSQDDYMTDRNQAGGTDAQPTMSDYNYDLGFGRDGNGRS